MPSSHNRSLLSHKIRMAVRHPDRVLPYGRRWVRDFRLRLPHPDHVRYYRGVMSSNVARSPELAVGSPTHEAWLFAGQMQFDYLRAHGLERGMRMLEIGCGNLRAGRLFIDFLDEGDYWGIDISPDILFAALDTISAFELQAKCPRVAVVRDLRFGWLPTGAFDVVHAHSVFSHSAPEVVAQCLAHVGRIMAPNGFFDFTVHLTEGTEHHVLREDFYYRRDTIARLAESNGLRAQLLEDWEGLHLQSKFRVTRA